MKTLMELAQPPIPSLAQRVYLQKWDAPLAYQQDSAATDRFLMFLMSMHHGAARKTIRDRLQNVSLFSR